MKVHIINKVYDNGVSSIQTVFSSRKKAQTWLETEIESYCDCEYTCKVTSRVYFGDEYELYKDGVRKYVYYIISKEVM